MIVSYIPKYGDKGLEVKVLQEALNKKGAKLKVDSIFGPLTSQAVIDFKKSINLYPSNIVAEWVLKELGITLTNDDAEVDRDEINPNVNEYLDDIKGEIEIVKVGGTFWQSKGKFKTKSGRPMGLLLHYAVSGNNKAAAINMVKWFARTPKELGYQLACPFLDKDGIFYTSEN